MKIKYKETILDRMEEAVKDAKVRGLKIQEIKLTEKENEELNRLCIDPMVITRLENIQYMGIIISKFNDMEKY